MEIFFDFVFMMLVISVFVIPHRWAQLWRWLKGSRKTYYLKNPNSSKQSEVLNTDQKIRFGVDRIIGFNPGIMIEIGRGLFRKPSQILGRGHLWLLTQDWRDGNTDWVRIEDTRGVSVTTALRLVNRYPSLQAMLDRIAELEKEFIQANQRKPAALQALELKISGDKQRFRSPAAKEIHANIRFILQELGEVYAYRQPVDFWLNKLAKPEANLIY